MRTPIENVRAILRMAMETREGRVRVLEEPDETPGNTPEDVRIYVKVDDESVVIEQGDDLLVVGVEDWERFCTEVMGAIMGRQRRET